MAENTGHGDGTSGRKRLSTDKNLDSGVSTSKKKKAYKGKGVLYKCTPVSDSVRRAARSASIGSTWWAKPMLSEVQTSLKSLPEKYSHLLDRTGREEDTYNPVGEQDDILQTDPDVADCLMLTNKSHEEPRKANLLQGYLLAKYCRGVIKVKQDHFDCGLLAVLAQVKGWEEDPEYSSQHLRRQLVIHFSSKCEFFYGKCKTYLEAQMRSMYQWGLYILQNDSFMDMIAFIVLRDLLEVTISLVSPGPLPKTRLSVDSVVASGHDTVLWERDLKRLQYMGVPVVVAWNGRHHFCATQVVDPIKLNTFKVSVMGNLLKCVAEASNDVNPDLLTDEAAAQLAKLKKSVSDSRNMFEGDPRTFTSVEKLTGATTGQRADVPPPAPTPMAPVHEEPAAETSGARPKKYKCKDQLCTETFSRTGTRDLHMYRAHNIGSGWFCKVEGCKEAERGHCFAGQGALNVHHRTQHQNIWKYICKKRNPDPKKKGICGWRTDNSDAVAGHNKTKHGEGRTHECPHCGKDTFASETLLKKHLKTADCTVGKNFVCDYGTCRKSYKTPGGLNIHKQVHVKTATTGKAPEPELEPDNGNGDGKPALDDPQE